MDAIRVTKRASVTRRVLGLALGAGTQIVFLITIWFLFWFLKGDGPSRAHGTLWIDVLLAIQFALPHSILLLPSVRGFLGRWIAREFYALFYCLVTCTGLLVAMTFWRVSDVVLWQLHGLSSVLVQAAFYASWIALSYSLSLSGFGTQTGLPQWWCWVRRRPMAHTSFKPRGAYSLLRHPVYLSFAGLLWFTSRMTLDHAVLTGLWTTYILLGSVLKDRRMEFYLGNAYRAYQRRVPGFPLVPFGPLGRQRRRAVVDLPRAERSSSAIRRDAA